MNEATKRFLTAVAHDPTLTDEQKLLIQIVAELNRETMEKVIDRLVDSQEETATRPPVQESSAVQR